LVMESFRMSNGIAFHKNELLTKKEKRYALIDDVIVLFSILVY